MDAGIASQANIHWLRAQDYHYLVFSREHHRELPGDDSVIVKEDPDNRVTFRRSQCEDTGEIRFQLKQQGINWSWDSIRRVMGGQHRVTVSMKTQAGDIICLRTSTKAEVDQQLIYDALGMGRDPVGRRQTELTS